MLNVRETIDRLGGSRAVAEALKDEFGEPKAPTVGMWAVRNQVPNRWKSRLRQLAGHDFKEDPPKRKRAVQVDSTQSSEAA